MRKLKVAAVMALSLAMLSLTGCGLTTFNNFKAAFVDKDKNNEEIIQIGVLEPVTGADSVEAELEIRGMQLANKVHPTIDGKKIELVFADNKSDIYSTGTAVETLLAKGPKVVLGSYGSVYSLAAGEQIKEAEIPAIAATNANPLVTKNNPYYFRVCYADANQGRLLARYVLHSRNEKTAGILSPEDDDAATAMAKEFKDRMRVETGNEDAIACNESYKTGSENFSKQLNELKKSGVKTVLLPGDVTDAIKIINEAAEDGTYDIQFLGDAEWGDKSFHEKLADNVDEDDVAFVQFYSSDGEVVDDEVAEEQELFHQTSLKEGRSEHEMDDDNVALGYDAYMVAYAAIAEAGTDASGSEIRDVMANSDRSFVGVSGKIRFNSYGDPAKTAYINTWKKDVNTGIYTLKPETNVK